MNEKKAQFAYEFLLIFFFLTILFTLSVITIGSAKERITDETNALHLEDYARSLQEEFYLVATMPEGFTKIITLPPTINNKPYDLTLHSLQDEEGNNYYYYFEISLEEITLDYRLPKIKVIEIEPKQQLQLRNNQGTVEVELHE